MIRVEGAGVREPIPLEAVVEIRVRVEMEDGESFQAWAHGPNNRPGDGVIAAEHDGARVAREERNDSGLDGGTGITGAVEHDIAGIGEQRRDVCQHPHSSELLDSVRSAARMAAGPAAAPR